MKKVYAKIEDAKDACPDEEFEISPGVEIDPDLYWHVTFTLFETQEDLDDDLLVLSPLLSVF